MVFLYYIYNIIYMYSPLEQFDSIILIFNWLFIVGSHFNLHPQFTMERYRAYKPWGLPSPRIVILLFTDYFHLNVFSFLNILLPLVLLIFFICLFRVFKLRLKLIPSTIFQRVLELKLNFNLSLIKQQLGTIGFCYTIFIFTIFYFILYLNLFSLLPFGIALTSHLILIVYVSLSICIGIFFEGYIVSGEKFFSIFLPKSPLAMLPLLIIIELFSYIIRMFSLAIRLVANIMAGHTLIYIISTFTLMITSINFLFLFIGILLISIIMLLELGVACLQAYVFTILILIYINDIYGGH